MSSENAVTLDRTRLLGFDKVPAPSADEIVVRADASKGLALGVKIGGKPGTKSRTVAAKLGSKAGTKSRTLGAKLGSKAGVKG